MYTLLLQGLGEGCDYTIGCNKTWTVFKAESDEEAIAKCIGPDPATLSAKELKDRVRAVEYGGINDLVDRPWSEYRDILLMNENGIALDLKARTSRYREVMNAQAKEEARSKQEASDREQLERLAKKFGKTLL